MRVILPFHAGDAAEALQWMRWVAHLSPKIPAQLTLAVDVRTPPAVVDDVRRIAYSVFDGVTVIAVPHVAKWPDGPNAMFRFTAAATQEPFLWMEPDAIPLHPLWHSKIAEEYRESGKLFLGHIYQCSNPRLPARIMSGIAVYPANALQYVPCLPNSPLAWDVEAAELMIANGAHTQLITHFWGEPGLPPTFVRARSEDSPRNAFALDQIPPSAVIWHRCKDGSLIDLLSNGEVSRKPPSPAKKELAVVSLRRAGDIVSLLPCIKAMAERERVPAKMIVHRDFVSLFDGLSYVEPEPWDGSWEEPIAAAAAHRAVNAQVAGRGVVTDWRNGNFAKDAWKLIGGKWNRYLPVVFDRRNVDREVALYERVANEKPLLLVKLHGHSSPFAHAADVKQRLTERYKECASVVMLDDVKAERLYDLMGLMDVAACMVSIDTVTLHLAGGSPVPTIAFTNGTAFGATPWRGNCLMRVPYDRVLERWQSIEMMIDKTLHANRADSLTHVYSYFKPANPDTQRRNDAAFLTWPQLGGRQIPFVGRRSSALVGDPRSMPFVRDMVAAAFADGNHGICVISNNDIQFDAKLGGAIRDACERWGCYWAYRLDHPGGTTDQGADVFAFTAKWWRLHEHFFPDFILGYPCWDDCLVRMMMWSGCAEQPRLYYHEPHGASDHRTRAHGPGHNYNIELMRQWCHTMQDDWEKPADRK